MASEVKRERRDVAVVEAELKEAQVQGKHLKDRYWPLLRRVQERRQYQDIVALNKLGAQIEQSFARFKALSEELKEVTETEEPERKRARIATAYEEVRQTFSTLTRQAEQKHKEYHTQYTEYLKAQDASDRLQKETDDLNIRREAQIRDNLELIRDFEADRTFLYRIDRKCPRCGTAGFTSHPTPKCVNDPPCILHAADALSSNAEYFHLGLRKDCPCLHL